MKKVVLTFGIIAGLIIAILEWLVASLADRGTIGLERLEFIGYSSMLVALSMVFFGIKSYRDNYSGGTMTFWKGLQVGCLISLIAGLLYFGGAASYGLANPGFKESFMVKFTEIKVNKPAAEGASPDKIEAGRKEVELMRYLFDSPVIFFLVCLMEILPVGFLVAIISAAILRRKDVLPSQKVSQPVAS